MELGNQASKPPSNLRVYIPHGIRGKFESENPVCIDESVYLDNTGDIIIGKYCSISNGAMLYTHEHYHNKGLNTFEAVEQKGIIVGGLVLEEDVYIGARAIILGSVQRLAKGTVIGAGSIVTKSIENEYEIWAGNPAKKIGKRQ